MTRYVVALLDVFTPEVIAEVESQLPEDFELIAARTYDEQEKLDAVSGADFILAGWASVPASTIDAAPKLKLIQKWGIGVDKIDIKHAAERGVPVTIAAGSNRIPVAELAILLMLAVYRRLPYVDRKLREGVWLKSEMRSLSYQLNRKTVGLVGLGNIGREVARRLQGFNTRTVYYDVRRPSAELEAQLAVEFRPMEEIFAHADVISLHVPLTSETRHLVNERTISRMKPTAIVVNTCRGEVIDEAALAAALRSGRILGAGLDVFAPEPPEPGNPLYELDNVVLTPHIAGAAKDNVANVARHSFGNMLRVLRGEPLPEADLVRPQRRTWTPTCLETTKAPRHQGITFFGLRALVPW